MLRVAGSRPRPASLADRAIFDLIFTSPVENIRKSSAKRLLVVQPSRHFVDLHREI